MTGLTKTPGISAWIASPLSGVFKGILKDEILNIVYSAVSLLNIFYTIDSHIKGGETVLKKKKLSLVWGFFLTITMLSCFTRN